MINRLINWSLQNRLLVVFIAILVAVAGILCFYNLPVDVYPDLNAPLVNIVTESHGMPSEDVERLITRPLESILYGAPHVTRVRSESSLGISVVTVEFNWGTDIYLARQLVTSRLELIANQLPAGTMNPILGPVSSRMGEVFEFVVDGEGEVDPMELRSTADWVIRYRLLGVPGISFVINMGGFIKQYQVLIDPNQLKNYNIAVADVKNAIEENNYNPSGGLLLKSTQEYVVRGLGRIESLEHIKNTVVTARNNVPVYVKDVAEIKIGHQMRRGISSRSDRKNKKAREVVDVVIEKQYGGNTLRTIENLKNALEDITRSFPDNIKIKAYYDQSVLIWNSIHHMEKAMIEGAVLVFLVILLFMGNIRTAVITSLTIPLSVLFSFILMYIFNIQITVMSLGGLAIGIGKMANSSIIMVENIFRILREEKGDIAERVLYAAKEVGIHIFHASLIIILVFIPMFALTGIEGKMFFPVVFAVAASLCGGLLCSLTVQPVLSFWLLREKLSVKDVGIINYLKKIYKKSLEICLHHRIKVLFTTIIIFLMVLLGIMPRVGTEFMPEMDEGSLILSTVMLPGTSLEESNRIGEKVQEIMMEFPEVMSINRNTGRAEQSEHAHGVNHSHFIMELVQKSERDKSLDELLAGMRTRLDEVPGINYIFEQPIQNKLAEMLTGIAGEISIKLFGPDLNVLGDKIEEIHNVVSGVKGVADLHIEQSAGTPQVNVILDRKALALYGLNIGVVSEVIETALNGIDVTDILEGHKKFSVFIRFQEKYRGDVESIKKILIDTPSGQRVPLENLAKFEMGSGQLTIMRENGMCRRVIICNVHDVDQGTWVAQAQQAIKKQVRLPEGYYVAFGGQFESYQRAFKSLIILALIVAVIVFFLLFESFGSFKQAIIILLNVPFAMMGGVIALFITGIHFNVSSIIGFIALFGISIQNAILLVAFINNMIKEGMSVRDAITEGTLVRMRPILITELVIIAGVLPLALFTGTSGSELQQPMAVVYIGGVLTDLFITMLQLPVLYSLFGHKNN